MQVACAAHPSHELLDGADIISSPASHSSVSCLLQVVEMTLYQSYLTKEINNWQSEKSSKEQYNFPKEVTTNLKNETSHGSLHQ